LSIRVWQALTPGGVIIIKDNTLAKTAFWIDADDAYFIRSLEYFTHLFRIAGMDVIAVAQQVRGARARARACSYPRLVSPSPTPPLVLCLQEKWPEDAYPVHMFALVRRGPPTETDAE
jgi:hypothetical protein